MAHMKDLDLDIQEIRKRKADIAEVKMQVRAMEQGLAVLEHDLRWRLLNAGMTDYLKIDWPRLLRDCSRES